MWVLGLICAVLVIVAMSLLIKPLFSRYSITELQEKQKKADQRKALNIDLYEQKKVQIEQDFANGLLDEEGRIQAKNEIEHSLLNDAALSSETKLTQLSNSDARKLSIAFLLFVPIFSLIIYLFISPDKLEQIVMAQPVGGSVEATSKKQVPDIATMVKSLEKKLNEQPENALGWNMLGRSYVVLKRYSDASKAYEKALALVQQGKAEQEMPELEINYVEALMQTGDKNNYQKARRQLTTLLQNDPNNGDALWFMGFLDYEAGDKQQAITRWTQLLSLLPKEGEQAKIVMTYLNQVKGAVSQVASKTTTEELPQTNSPATQAPSSVSEKPRPNQQLTGTSQEQAFIASMIARVEKRVLKNPKDLKGWTSLGKSYGVLNRQVDSANAYAKAVALDHNNANLLMAYSNAVIKSARLDQLDKARIFFAQLVDQNPQHLDALFLSGSLAKVAGDNKQAKLFWDKLLPQLGNDTEAYKTVQHNLDSLK